MQIGSNPAQWAQNEDISKPSDVGNATLPGLDAPGNEAFGDLLRGPDDANDPDPANDEAIALRAGDTPHINALSLPDSGQGVPAGALIFTTEPGAASGDTGDEAPKSGLIVDRGGVSAPGTNVTRNPGTNVTRNIARGGPANRMDEHISSEMQAGIRQSSAETDVSNISPRAAQAELTSNSSVTKKGLPPRTGKQGEVKGEGLNLHPSNSGLRTEHAAGKNARARHAPLPGLEQATAPSKAAQEGGKYAIPDDTAHASNAGLRGRTRLSEPARSDAVPGNIRESERPPHGAINPEKQGTSTLNIPHEKRDAARDHVSDPRGQILVSANLVRQHPSPQVGTSAFSANGSSGRETTGGRQAGPTEAGEQKQPVSAPIPESGQSQKTGEAAAKLADTPHHQASPADKAPLPPVSRQAVTAEGIPAMARPDQAQTLTGVQYDTVISNGDTSTHQLTQQAESPNEMRVSEPSRSGRDMPPERGNLPVMGTRLLNGQKENEKTNKDRDGLVVGDVDGIGLQSAHGLDPLREISSAVRGHPSPHIPATERHVIHQIAQAAAHFTDRPIELRLNPEELGHVRLVLSLGDNNTLSISILAERPETLDLMRRNINELAQEFRDLGYTSPEFSFGSGMSDQQGMRDNAPHAPGFAIEAKTAGANAVDAAVISHPETLVLEMSERLDLRL